MQHSNLWIDMINPSDVHFFNSLINDLLEYNIFSTTRERAETVSLANNFQINNKVIGRDYNNATKKALNMVFRTINLSLKIPSFDYSLSFENGMSILVSRLYGKKSIVYCDNDLKFLQRKNSFQDLEMKIKSLASYTIVPEACFDNFQKYCDESKLISFDGLKEDVYIADYNPDKSFLRRIPFDNFIVIRPEALASMYVKSKKSIVPELLKAFIKENINVIYIPRDEGDAKYADGTKVFIPHETLNGLDLCYYADAILTGSGTLAREAACMGAKSVSFFPSDVMLSPDQRLIDGKKVFHSRDVTEIVDYVLSPSKNREPRNFLECRKIKNEVTTITKEILEGER
ncbi:MAG TPA: DUF354 domain-containing protein [Clostridia bacterium]|nr:DUF354 domain-containing protein [Clostridia bacterium]